MQHATLAHARVRREANPSTPSADGPEKENPPGSSILAPSDPNDRTHATNLRTKTMICTRGENFKKNKKNKTMTMLYPGCILPFYFSSVSTRENDKHNTTPPRGKTNATLRRKQKQTACEERCEARHRARDELNNNATRALNPHSEHR